MKILFVCGVVLLVGVFSCKKVDNKQLCVDFYKLNKDKSFDGLYDIMFDSRVSDSEYDDNIGKNVLTYNHVFVYDPSTDNFLHMPIFKPGASVQQKAKAYNQCGQMLKNLLAKKLEARSDSELQSLYIDYIGRMMRTYNEIKTPATYNNISVPLEAHPNLGNFLIFKLNKNARCYYLKNREGLSNYWAKFFSEGRKLDEHWFYEVIPEK